MATPCGAYLRCGSTHLGSWVAAEPVASRDGRMVGSSGGRALGVGAAAHGREGSERAVASGLAGARRGGEGAEVGRRPGADGLTQYARGCRRVVS